METEVHVYKGTEHQGGLQGLDSATLLCSLLRWTSIHTYIVCPKCFHDHNIPIGISELKKQKQKLTMPSADENVEQSKLPSTTGDNAQWFGPPENNLAVGLAKVNINDHIIQKAQHPHHRLLKDHVRVSVWKTKATQGILTERMWLHR